MRRYCRKQSSANLQRSSRQVGELIFQPANLPLDRPGLVLSPADPAPRQGLIEVPPPQKKLGNLGPAFLSAIRRTTTARGNSRRHSCPCYGLPNPIRCCGYIWGRL
jgi:hypothetical protein